MIQQLINLEKGLTNKNLIISLFIRFLNKIKLKKLLNTLQDAREKNKISFSSSSLFLYALSIFFFRMESKHSFESCVDNLLQEGQKKILNFLSCKSLPTIRTIDDFLKKIELEELNGLLLNLFRILRQNKLFYNHLELLGEEGSFYLGCDGLHIHTYYEKHEPDCPYCLKRERTENGKTHVFYFHILAFFVLIFPSGLKLPLYVYPIHAKNITADLSEKKLKQECEITAISKVLPILREKLKKQPITLGV